MTRRKYFKRVSEIVYEVEMINNLLREVEEQEDLCWLNSRETLYMINSIWGKEETLELLNQRKNILLDELENM